jgi:hypothetical protein
MCYLLRQGHAADDGVRHASHDSAASFSAKMGIDRFAVVKLTVFISNLDEISEGDKDRRGTQDCQVIRR